MTQDGHIHSNADVILVVARRIIELVEPQTTPAGVKDAQACMENGVARNKEEMGELAVLMSKLSQIYLRLYQDVEPGETVVLAL